MPSKPQPKPKPHPVHSGDAPFVFQGDKHYHTHNHLAPATQSALQVCLSMMRGVRTRSEREALLGHLLATLLHEKAISGLMRAFDLAGHHVNHYRAEIDTRRF